MARSREGPSASGASVLAPMSDIGEPRPWARGSSSRSCRCLETVPQPRLKPASKTAARRNAPPPSLDVDVEDQEGALPAGTRLDEFEIIRVLGIGGFGIVYLARDHALLRQVAIKEYMPSELARRRPDMRISVRRGPHAETFAAGLQSFVKEAQLLARFDHPSLVKVYRYWQGNGTAYMAMQYYEGRTLQQERRALTAAPSEVWLRGLVYSLLGALDVLHAQGVFHRDISPDNILLLPDGCPVLLDFGAARHVVGNGPQALTAVFKPNFAPIEQCGEIPGLLQGPWTDLYALGAVVHFMLTGHAPMPAMVRAVHDAMPALSAPETGMQGLSSAFLASIDWTLGVRPEERPRDAQMLRDALEGIVQPPPVVRWVDGSDLRARSGHPEAGPASADWTPTVQATTRIERPDASGASVPPVEAGGEDGTTRVGHPGEVRVRSGMGWRGVATGAALALAVAAVTVWGLGMTTGLRMSAPAVPSTPADAGEVVVSPAPVPPQAVADAPIAAAAEPLTPTGRANSAGAGRASGASAQGAAPESGATRPADASAASTVSRDAGAAREASTPTDAAAARRRGALPVPAAAPAASEPHAEIAVALPAKSVRSATIAGRATERGATTTAVGASPRAACGDRNFVSMAVCMTRECSEPAFREHQECREFRRYEEARQQSQMSR